MESCRCTELYVECTCVHRIFKEHVKTLDHRLTSTYTSAFNVQLCTSATFHRCPCIPLASIGPHTGTCLCFSPFYSTRSSTQVFAMSRNEIYGWAKGRGMQH